jgi:PD-(D/E)XK nuclease superfamily
MLCGLYFEDRVLGGTRDGHEVVLPKLKNGSDSQMEKDLKILVAFANKQVSRLGIDVSKGRTQVKLEHDGLVGHLDHVNYDIDGSGQLAIYDLKYTETKYDDKWIGWGDFSNKWDSQLQAIHYTYLFNKTYGYTPNFYFLVFGKGGWQRTIKVEVSADRLKVHESLLHTAKTTFKEMEAEGFKADPGYTKCNQCPFRMQCRFRALVPNEEKYSL